MKTITPEEDAILAYGILNYTAWKRRTLGSKFESEIDKHLARLTPLYNADEDKRPADEKVTPETAEKTYAPADFLDLFTLEQYTAIKAQERTDIQLAYFFDRLRTERTIRVNGATTINGVNYLVSEGLISQADADRILND